jgi:DNA-binding transcriptional LysR family regulator
MDTRRLRIFAVVAEELNFSRAATRLNMSQPAVSQHVQALETELRTKLFQRAGRGVRLSAAGELFLSEASNLVSRIERIETTLHRAESGEIGTLTLAFNELAGQQEVLGLALRRFRAQSPDVQLDMVQLSTSSQIEALGAVTIDAGFLYDLGQPLTGLSTLPIQRDKFVLAIANSDPLSRRSRVMVKDISGQTLIVPSRKAYPEFYRRLTQHIASLGAHPKDYVEVASDLAAINLVSVGMGIAPVPSTRRWGDSGAIVFRPMPGPPATMLLVLAWRNAHMRPALRRFVDVVRQTCSRVAEQ